MEYLVYRSRAQNSSSLKHQRAESQAGSLGNIVGYYDAGQILLPDNLCNQILDAELGGVVQCRSRLIQKKH